MTKKRWMIAGSLLFLAILYLKVISPLFNIHIPCVFKAITGYNCPGCGITRASLALLEGNFYQAFRWNMLVFILLPLFGIYHFLAKNPRFKKQSDVLMFSMLTLAILFFVLRNTTTFAWLAPTYIG